MSGSIVAGGQDELKARVRELKKKPMNCAIGDVGKLAEVRLHPTRQPTALLAELRNDEPKVVKPACGLAFVPEEKPDEVRLDLRTKPAGGICRRVAKRLKGTGLRKVVLLVMGEVVESFHVEEAEGAGQEQDDPSPDLPDADALMRRLKTAGEAMRTIPAPDARGRDARVLLGAAIEALRGEQLVEAADLTRRLEEQVAAALGAAAPQGGPKPAGPGAGAAGSASGQPAPEQPPARQPAPAGSEGYAAALRGAQGDLKAARAIDGQPGNEQRLVRLIQDIAAAHTANDWAQAEALVKQARSVAVRMLSDEQVRASQTATYDRMAPLFAKVEKTYFTDASVIGLAQADLKPGKEFQAFIAKQYAFMNKPSIAGCDAIAQAADAYLAHRKADLNRLQRSGKDSQAKKVIAENAKVAARHMKAALELKAMGAPPWDARTAMRAQELCAAFNFETTFGPMPEDRSGQMAKPLGRSGGVSASFWVTGRDAATGKDEPGSNQYLFKPAKGEDPIEGFPAQGSTPREAVSKAMADAIRAMTGLDLGVPETSVVTIPPEAIDTAAFNASRDEEDRLPTDQPLTGSLQQFRNSSGLLGAALRSDPDLLGKLDPAECQRMAVLDILTLNCDRHANNFMVTGGAVPSLIPIDHGLTLPCGDGLAKAFSDRAANPGHNILLNVPANLAPFSDEVVQRLDMLDPEELAAKVLESRDTIAEGHPELDVPGLIPARSADHVKRAAAALKQACRRLSPAMVQILLATEHQAVFGTTDGEFDAALEAAIARMEGKAPALTELIRRRFDRHETRSRLMALGWHDFDQWYWQVPEYRRWVFANPELVLAALVGDAPPPAGYAKPPVPPQPEG